jgi:hypothetical protein
VATNPSPYSANSYPDSFGNGVLSIALISPEKNRRAAAVAALASSANSQISQLTDYPQGLDDVPKMHSPGQRSLVRAVNGGEHLRQRRSDGHGVFR